MIFKRSVSILRPSPITVVPTNVLNGSKLDLKPLFKDVDRSNESSDSDGHVATTQFQLLGENPTLASIQVSPSIPLYVKHRSLVSIHDSEKLSNVHLSYKKMFTLWPTFSLSRFDRLTGLNQFNCLVSSRTPSDTLSILQLKGTQDWLVTDSKSVVAFEENASLSLQWFHKWINFYKWKTNKVDVFASYGKLSGRGNVLLNGNGSVYKLELKSSNDQILLQKNRLLAFNGANLLDFKEAVSFERSAATLEETPEQKEHIQDASRNAFHEALDKVSRFIVSRWQSVRRNTDFVRVKGPRTVLVQTDAMRHSPKAWSGYPVSLKPAKNYLSFAKVHNGTVNFKNTPSLLAKK